MATKGPTILCADTDGFKPPFALLDSLSVRIRTSIYDQRFRNEHVAPPNSPAERHPLVTRLYPMTLLLIASQPVRLYLALTMSSLAASQQNKSTAVIWPSHLEEQRSRNSADKDETQVRFFRMYSPTPRRTTIGVTTTEDYCRRDFVMRVM
ncbi:hypothetical protein MBLNU457_6368t1 [Dothideomycetes sp. NU457]